MSGPPGHLIISGVGLLVEKMTEYIDRILQPFVANTFSYVKDTSHLLTLLHEVTLPPNTLLGTLDIEAWYTSIHHTWGLQTIPKNLSSRPLNKRPHNRLIIELLEFLLKNNKF